ncbi:MAG: UvrD-helicase domain-containing protein [Acidobacteria bacterium]|nr:UvrD-helicase domain-containing protein [Acidobacteriota bacterium]
MNPSEIEKTEQGGHLSGLNTQQREAVTTTKGPILILAGAGSGKTRVITYRIVHLIEFCGVRPENILAVTFTNKAAGEMKDRVDQLLGDKPRLSSPLLSTFHSLCVRILRRNIEKLERGYTRSFTIYDTDDQQSLLRACIKDRGYDDKYLTARQAQSAISAAKNRGEDPELYGSKTQFVDPRRAAIAQIYALYEQKLNASNALDFDDLLIRTVQLLRQSEDTRHYYHERFRHVMVDEFQDTNGIQHSLTRLIVEGDFALNLGARPEHFWENRSLCVVGDENQSIYKFRGSDFNIILNFPSQFPGTKTIKLEDNYRSTGRILEAANRVISHNAQRFDKILRANAPEGERVRYAQLEDGESEARWVTGKIEEQMRREPGIRAAVLYRTNAQSRAFEEACRRAGLRYNLVGGFSFYDRAEVKDIISYLKLAVNPNDSMALMRVINTPPRGIGKTTLEEVERRSIAARLSLWETIEMIIEQELLAPRSNSALKVFSQIILQLIARAGNPAEPISEIVKAAVLDSGYERMLKEEMSEEAEGRLLNLQELVNAAVESDNRGESLSDFLDHAALVSDTDDYQADAQVTLMTMHSAKGLEFPLIFIAGMEENLFPHSRASEPEELEEERRLCYVAITRAKQYLYLTHARMRRVYGEQLPSEPSRFLNEFPLELIEDLSHGRSWLRLAKKASTSGSRESQWEPERPQNTRYYPPKGRGNYQGKTYNDSSGVKEFFARQGKQIDPDAFKSSAGKLKEDQSATGGTGLKVGMRVRHAKYGQGLIVRREGEGENTKLTINFPGYGHKKMIEKYAALERI